MAGVQDMNSVFYFYWTGNYFADTMKAEIRLTTASSDLRSSILPLVVSRPCLVKWSGHEILYRRFTVHWQPQCSEMLMCKWPSSPMRSRTNKSHSSLREAFPFGSGGSICGGSIRGCVNITKDVTVTFDRATKSVAATISVQVGMVHSIRYELRHGCCPRWYLTRIRQPPLPNGIYGITLRSYWYNAIVGPTRGEPPTFVWWRRSSLSGRLIR
jgi:hypothetical protein